MMNSHHQNNIPLSKTFGAPRRPSNRWNSWLHRGSTLPRHPKSGYTSSLNTHTHTHTHEKTRLVGVPGGLVTSGELAPPSHRVGERIGTEGLPCVCSRNKFCQRYWSIKAETGSLLRTHRHLSGPRSRTCFRRPVTYVVSTQAEGCLGSYGKVEGGHSNSRSCATSPARGTCHPCRNAAGPSCPFLRSSWLPATRRARPCS